MEKTIIKGTLIPVGGNEDKGESKDEMYTLDFVKEGILSRIVKESGGKEARIVVVPTASSIPVEVGDNYLNAFDKLDSKQVEVLDIRERSQAESQAFVSKIEQADCVMFSGGDQSRISEIIGGTAMHKVLSRRYQDEDFVIAGTSAGAMAMSTEMIAGGSSSESFIKGAVRMRDGMSLIPGLIIDSHFIRRGRFGRLAEAVATFPDLLGVGLAEDTGLVIKNCNRFTVIGSGMVILFDPGQLQHNNQKILEPGTPMSVSNLIVHVLSNSDSFFVKERKLEILPIEADYEEGAFD